MEVSEHSGHLPKKIESCGVIHVPERFHNFQEVNSAVAGGSTSKYVYLREGARVTGFGDAGVNPTLSCLLVMFNLEMSRPFILMRRRTCRSVQTSDLSDCCFQLWMK